MTKLEYEQKIKDYVALCIELEKPRCIICARYDFYFGGCSFFNSAVPDGYQYQVTACENFESVQ
jgi:hypothetical protein